MGLNVSGGFRALGQGLQLIAERQGRREEMQWQAMREENLARLRQQLDLEVEGVRAENNRQESDADRRWRTAEAAKGRRADDARQRRADDAADRRLTREISAKNPPKTDAEKTYEMYSTEMQNLAKQIRDVEDAHTKAVDAGDEKMIVRYTSRLAELQNEQNDKRDIYQARLEALGHPLFIGRGRDAPPQGAGGEQNPPAAGGPAQALIPAPARSKVEQGGSRGGRSRQYQEERMSAIDKELEGIPAATLSGRMSPADYSRAMETNKRRKALMDEKNRLRISLNPVDTSMAENMVNQY